MWGNEKYLYEYIYGDVSNSIISAFPLEIIINSNVPGNKCPDFTTTKLNVSNNQWIDISSTQGIVAHNCFLMDHNIGF